MFAHYLGKFNSFNLLQITTEKLKSVLYLTKKETFMLSYGWKEISVLFSSALILLKMFAVCLHASAKTLAPLVILHYQWCSGRCSSHLNC